MFVLSEGSGLCRIDRTYQGLDNYIIVKVVPTQGSLRKMIKKKRKMAFSKGQKTPIIV